MLVVVAATTRWPLRSGAWPWETLKVAYLLLGWPFSQISKYIVLYSYLNQNQCRLEQLPKKFLTVRSISSYGVALHKTAYNLLSDIAAVCVKPIGRPTSRPDALPPSLCPPSACFPLPRRPSIAPASQSAFGRRIVRTFRSAATTDFFTS